MQPHLGYTVRALLEDKNMSQRELAARTAVSSAYISNIINGDRPVSTSFACKLGLIFGVCPEKLLLEQVKREMSIYKPKEGYLTLLFSVFKEQSLMLLLMPKQLLRF